MTASPKSPLPLALRLRRNDFLHFAPRQRLCLRAERGTLWITIDGDLADVQLEAGASRVFDGSQPLTVGTLGGDAVVTATALAAPVARQTSILRRLAGLTDTLRASFG